MLLLVVLSPSLSSDTRQLPPPTQAQPLLLASSSSGSAAAASWAASGRAGANERGCFLARRSSPAHSHEETHDGGQAKSLSDVKLLGKCMTLRQGLARPFLRSRTHSALGRQSCSRARPQTRDRAHKHAARPRAAPQIQTFDASSPLPASPERSRHDTPPPSLRNTQHTLFQLLPARAIAKAAAAKEPGVIKLPLQAPARSQGL